MNNLNISVMYYTFSLDIWFFNRMVVCSYFYQFYLPVAFASLPNWHWRWNYLSALQLLRVRVVRAAVALRRQPFVVHEVPGTRHLKPPQTIGNG